MLLLALLLNDLLLLALLLLDQLLSLLLNHLLLTLLLLHALLLQHLLLGALLLQHLLLALLLHDPLLLNRLLLAYTVLLLHLTRALLLQLLLAQLLLLGALLLRLLLALLQLELSLLLLLDQLLTAIDRLTDRAGGAPLRSRRLRRRGADARFGSGLSGRRSRNPGRTRAERRLAQLAGPHSRLTVTGAGLSRRRPRGWRSEGLADSSRPCALLARGQSGKRVRAAADGGLSRQRAPCGRLGWPRPRLDQWRSARRGAGASDLSRTLAGLSGRQVWKRIAWTANSRRLAGRQRRLSRLRRTNELLTRRRGRRTYNGKAWTDAGRQIHTFRQGRNRRNHRLSPRAASLGSAVLNGALPAVFQQAV